MAAEGGRGAAATMQAPPAPRVGDARVRFRALSNPAEGVSLLAAAGGGSSTLRPWGEGQAEGRAERGPSWAKGGLYMLRRGVRSAEDLLQEANPNPNPSSNPSPNLSRSPSPSPRPSPSPDPDH